MIRVTLPFHLRRLAKVGEEVRARGRRSGRRCGRCSTRSRREYPVLRGTIRDYGTLRRRAFLRFFACEQDMSLDSPDAPLPEPVASGAEPLMVVGAIAGG